MNYLYITGSSSGLGKSIAEKALQHDFRVTGFARRKSIENENYTHVGVDLSDLNQTRAIEFGLHPDAGKIVLINNAGTAGEIKYLGEIEEEVLISGYNVNAISPHILINKFIAAYRSSSAQKIIINITSGAASSPYDGWSIYCATKAALDMISKCAAMEDDLRKTNFKIFAIAPGVLNTPMQDDLRNTDAHDFSRVDKFIGLNKNHQLADSHKVAEKIIEILENPAQLSGVIHRLQL